MEETQSSMSGRPESNSQQKESNMASPGGVPDKIKSEPQDNQLETKPVVDKVSHTQLMYQLINLYLSIIYHLSRHTDKYTDMKTVLVLLALFRGLIFNINDQPKANLHLSIE